MEFTEILDAEPDESATLEYKHIRTEKKDILKEIAALANEDGGKLLYGVHHSDGKIEEIQDISNYSGFEEDIQQKMLDRVNPRLDITVKPVKYDGKTVVGFEVTHQGVLHSVRPQNGRAFFPTRVGSTTDYMEGTAIREFYRSSAPPDSDYRDWLNEVRAIAHESIYLLQSVNLDKLSARRKFRRKATDAAQRMETLLSESHYRLNSETKHLMTEFIERAKVFDDYQVQEKQVEIVDSRDEDEIGDVLGESEEEIIEEMEHLSNELNQIASALEEKIKNQLI